MTKIEFENKINTYYKGLFDEIAYTDLNVEQTKKILNILYAIDKELGRLNE